MHTSLDGFVGGPNGEMDWIDVSDVASNAFSSGVVCLHYEGSPT
jgi:hypothetical protein